MLRVFGETPGGQKACLHIHRLFPYLYVPYDDDLPRGADGATAFLRGFAEALDRALDFGGARRRRTRARREHAPPRGRGWGSQGGWIHA